MKLKVNTEKPFNWVKGFEGSYLMNEDKQIKSSRIIHIKGNKKENHEALFLSPYLNENEEEVVMLLDNQGKIHKKLLKDLEVVKYKRSRNNPKT